VFFGYFCLGCSRLKLSINPEYINLEDHDNIKFQLQIQITPEAYQFLTYSPSLEVSAIGRSVIEAESMFNVAVLLLFEQLIEKGSLDQVLH